MHRNGLQTALPIISSHTLTPAGIISKAFLTGMVNLCPSQKKKKSNINHHENAPKSTLLSFSENNAPGEL